MERKKKLVSHDAGKIDLERFYYPIYIFLWKKTTPFGIPVDH